MAEPVADKPASAPRAVQLGVWGDSIVHGGNDEEKGGWVTRLKMYMMRRNLGDHVFDLGIGGDSSADVLSRIAAELTPRRNFIDYVLVAVGMNDLAWDLKLATPEQFRRNLEAIVAQVRAFDKRIYFLSITPTGKVSFDKWRTMNEVIRQVATEQGTGFLDLSAALTPADLPDEVHPRAAGHEKLFQAVKNALIRDGIIPPE